MSTLSGKTMMDTNVCEGIKIGDEVTFEVTLEATHCVRERITCSTSALPAWTKCSR